MIVDDEHLVRASIRNRMDWKSMHTEVVCEASNGEEALSMISQYHPDIMLVDICMPGVSGFELISKARELDHKLHFLVISGYSDYRYLRLGVQLKVDDYLCKPIDPRELYQCIKKITGVPSECSIPVRDEGNNDKMVDRICDYIRLHYEEKLSLTSISNEFFISPIYLSSYFKQHKGVNLFEYIRDIRIENAKLLLKSTDQSVTEIAHRVGYNDAAYFQRIFKNLVKMTPRQYRFHGGEKDKQEKDFPNEEAPK